MMTSLLPVLYLFPLLFVNAMCNKDDKVLIIIRGQSDSYHRDQSELLQANIYKQISNVLTENVHVTQMQAEWPVEEAWTILPIISDIARKHAEHYNWVMFLEEWTEIDIAKLQKFIETKDPLEDKLYAFALEDKEPVIIHHFKYDADDNLKYPDFDAGWILSSTLIKKMSFALEEEVDRPDFSIDVKHELAVFLSNKLDVRISHADEFCNAGITQKENPKCMTWVNTQFSTKCGDKVNVNDVFFAIKTTKMFHKTRVQIVRETWGALPIRKLFYSNVTDPEVPDSIDCGVPNTARGHCGKSDAILKDFVNNRKEKWLVIADDDTILSVGRMINLLNCYNHNNPIHLGERYGFGLNRKHGYSYITGGGGMIYSRPAAEVWVNDCACPSNDTPDDMFISQCIWYKKGVQCTHSPAFHQARPEDYTEQYLKNHKPVSFHKHWNNDPLKVYNKYFAEDDNLWLADLYKKGIIVQPPSVKSTPTPPPDIEPQPLPPTPVEDQHDEL